MQLISRVSMPYKQECLKFQSAESFRALHSFGFGSKVENSVFCQKFVFDNFSDMFKTEKRSYFSTNFKAVFKEAP